MRRAVLAVTGLAVGTPLLVALKLGPAGPQATAADQPAAARPAVSGSGSGAKADPGGEEGATPAPTKPAKKPAAKGGGKRTVVGSPQDNPYGTVKVQVVLDGKKIVDVQAVSLPQTEPRSISLNERAIPQLRQEVLTKQSATVDTVSGATFTSEGYLNSLQAALDAAGIGA